MSYKSALLRSATVGVFVALAAGAAHAETETAMTKTVKHHRHRVVKHEPAKRVEPAASAEEVRALKTEIEELKARLDTTAQAQQATAAEVASTQSKATEAAQNAAAAVDKVETIPEQVNVAVGQLPKPKSDALYLKGVKVTLGGFIAAESVYRTRGLGSDFSLPMGSIPFQNAAGVKSAQTSEWRQTARQSRISGLVEGDPTSDVHLSAYGEFDFLGAAGTANSNESNSYNLRIRNLYTTVDLKSLGLSLLAGQSWSLTTLNTNGITPRNEAVPLTIDAQYVTGFVWKRLPQIRLTENYGNGIWAAISVETPQTNGIGGTAALNPGVNGVSFNQASQGGSLFNPNVNYSFNHVPDVTAKVAYDNTVMGHSIHVEGFGLFRDFYDRVGSGCTSATVCTGFHNVDTQGGGFGFGLSGQVIPGLLDARLSGLYGRGIGDYGSGQLSDVYEQATGALQGLKEHMLLAGLTLHATPQLDIYGYAGQEVDGRSSYATTVGGKTVQGGYGNPFINSNLGGCELPTEAACSGLTKSAQELTIGAWDKVFSGSIGSFRVGLQYSYTARQSFSGEVSAAPVAYGRVLGDDNMIYTSIRYYPFQN